MLKIKDALILNKFAQGIFELRSIENIFLQFDLLHKRKYLEELISLIIQSKPIDTDIDTAINQSDLKSTYTPCVLLRKGVKNHNLQNLTKLPESELTKSLILLLRLFKISYLRRYKEEMNSPGKWWYWDLSIEKNIKEIEKTFSFLD